MIKPEYNKYYSDNGHKPNHLDLAILKSVADRCETYNDRLSVREQFPEFFTAEAIRTRELEAKLKKLQSDNDSNTAKWWHWILVPIFVGVVAIGFLGVVSDQLNKITYNQEDAIDSQETIAKQQHQDSEEVKGKLQEMIDNQSETDSSE